MQAEESSAAELRTIHPHGYLAKQICGIYRLGWVGARGKGAGVSPFFSVVNQLLKNNGNQGTGAFLVILLEWLAEGLCHFRSCGWGTLWPRSAGTGNREGVASPEHSCLRSDQTVRLGTQEETPGMVCCLRLLHLLCAGTLRPGHSLRLRSACSSCRADVL